MLILALVALIPLSIGGGSGDGSGGMALVVDAGGAEIGASISVPDESSEGASEDDESTCRWEPAVIYGLPVVDIDLVGDLDAFVAVGARDNYRVWINNGSAGFFASPQVFGFAHSQDVALGDIDGDGDLDAFVANEYCLSLIHI